MHDVIDIFLKLRISRCRNTDDNGIACLDLLDIGECLLVDIALRCKRDHGHALNDQRECSVLEFARRIRLGMDVGDLLEFQCALKRNGVIQPTTNVEDILVEAVLLRKGLDRVDVRQNLRDLRRYFLQHRYKLCCALCGNRPLDLRHIECKHEKENQLRRICLGRCDCDLRPRPRIDNLIRLARDGRADDIRDR